MDRVSMQVLDDTGQICMLEMLEQFRLGGIGMSDAEKGRVLEAHRKAMTAWIMSDWKDRDAERRMTELYEIMQGWSK